MQCNSNNPVLVVDLFDKSGDNIYRQEFFKVEDKQLVRSLTSDNFQTWYNNGLHVKIKLISNKPGEIKREKLFQHSDYGYNHDYITPFTWLNSILKKENFK